MSAPLRFDTPGLRWDDPRLHWDGQTPESNMPYGNIDVTLTPEQLQAIKDAFAAVDALMPWAVGLTEEERRRLYKAGNKLEVIEECRNAVVNNPGIFPTSFDGDGFVRDVNFLHQVTDLTAVAAALLRKLDDTRMACGAECAKTINPVRGYVDTAAKTQPGLQELSKKLAEYFKRGPQTPDQPTPPTP